MESVVAYSDLVFYNKYLNKSFNWSQLLRMHIRVIFLRYLITCIMWKDKNGIGDCTRVYERIM
jgi:hypothetical protein